ncbi:MAG: response regulator [Desulfobacterales bacterium]|jgi:response regulator RpfG family c-di-GMP phosphodiesterase|nr:response regulator [Desulfobacterales bacterium]
MSPEAGRRRKRTGQLINGDQGKILFVDDEESILEIAREYFEQKGYPVITAGNGFEAVNILDHEKIACCFTDINMPEMDGLELAERIRAVDNTIPVVVMTGYPSLDNTIRTLRNGVVDFLVKPVSLNQMELCLRRVLRERRLFVENLILKKEVEGKERLEKLNQELLYKVEGLNILNKILSDLAVVGSNQEVFSRVVDMTLEITRADEARFYVINWALNTPVEVAAAFSPRRRKDGGVGLSEFPGNELNLSPGTDEKNELSQLIVEIAADEIPLLISENTGARGLPADIRSFMIVPLKIREKIFGVLTAAITHRARRFTEKELYYLSFLTQNAAHSIENIALYENIYSNLFATLYAFVKAIEVRDPYTKQHSTRVTEISLRLGKAMECSPEELDILKFACPLHDIGKIGIRDAILLKPGRLTRDEYQKIKEHPLLGADIVGRLGMWGREQQIIRYHHERYDGTGYPEGLRGDTIPLLSRILSVADAYDAMASDRAYRQKMDPEQILRIIESGAGTQFDPKVVSTFLLLHHHGKLEDITGESDL